MFSKIFPESIYQKGFHQIDLSAQNPDAVALNLQDLHTCNAYIEKLCNGKIGIGGYGEKRVWYAQSNIFRNENEARNIHLGVDIWAEAGTPIYNFWEGKIHSFAYNEGFGNYGGTIILEYEIKDFFENNTNNNTKNNNIDNFFVLYGHLSKKSLENIQENQIIQKGTEIAKLGNPSENGGWSPHLHIQIIKDMQGKKGDFIGVCYEKDKDFYLNLCPNPTDLIMN